MPSGRFGKANLAAGVDTDLFTCAAERYACAAIEYVNRTSSPIAVRLAVRSSALALSDYLEYDTIIPGNSGILERTQVFMSAGEIVTVRAASAGISVRAHGYEEAYDLASSCGRFGKVNLAANADTDIYTCPPGLIAKGTVAFCNRTGSPISARVAIRSGALALSDYLEYDTIIPANGVLERNQLVFSPGEIVTVRADALGLSVRAHGYVEVE